MKKTIVDTSPMTAETAAFNSLQDLLELLPARGVSHAEWLEIDAAYRAWVIRLESGALEACAPGSARAVVLERVARHRAEHQAAMKPSSEKQPLEEEEARREAFARLRRALDESPRPRHATEADWLERIEPAYEAWKLTLGPRELQGYRSEQASLRAKVIQAFEASPQALILDSLEKHRGRYYNAVREARRAAGVAARPSHRARLRQAAVEAARELDIDSGGYDYGRPRGRIDAAVIEDGKRWKAPEAAA